MAAAAPAAPAGLPAGASEVNLPFFFFLLLLEELLLEADDLLLELLRDCFFRLVLRLLFFFFLLEGLLLLELFCDDLLVDLLDDEDGVLDGLDSSESRKRLGFRLPKHRRSFRP